MANKIPPVPVGSLPGSSYWNDWYERIRNLINSGTISQLWASIDFTASNITDIVTRNHNNLQSFQGGTAGEYYHLTSAQTTTVGTLTSGTYTPTLTIVANLDAVTAYTAQYMRVGNMVTVSGKFDIDPTIVNTLTQFRATLPIASNFSAVEQCGGSASYSTITSRSLAVSADIANDSALFSFMCSDVTNGSIFYNYSYLVI